MAKKGKMIWAIIVTVIVAILINLGFSYIAAISRYGLAMTPVISAINIVITGFSAGLGFYFAKSLVEKK